MFGKSLQPDWSKQTHFLPDQTRFTLPSEDDAPLARVREIQQKRQGYLYGPSLLGNTSYFPTGFLGDAMVQQHVDSWLQDAAWVNRAVDKEASAAAAAIKEVRSTSSLIERLFLRNVEGWPREFQRLPNYLRKSMEDFGPHGFGTRFFVQFHPRHMVFHGKIIDESL